MLTDKAGYVFVSREAMRHIAVVGKPYPLRGEKLVLLGEDVSFFEEALREREYAAGGDEPYLGALAQLERPILVVYHDEAAWHARLKTAVSKGRSVDCTSLAKALPPGTSALVARFDGEKKGDFAAALQKFDAFLNQVRDRLEKDEEGHASEREKRRGQIEELTKKAEQDRKDAVKSAEDEAAEAEKREDERHDKALGDIDKAYYERKKEIAKRLGDGEIGGTEANVELAAAWERRGLDIDAETAKHAEAVQATDFWLEGAKADAEQKMLRDVARLNDEFEDWDDKWQEGFDREKEQGDASIRREAVSLFADCPGGFPYLCQYSEKYVEWQADFDSCRIGRLYSDAFFGRKVGFSPASTPVNRIFGDLDRMDGLYSPETAILRAAHTESRTAYGPYNVAYYNEGEGSRIDDVVQGADGELQPRAAFSNFTFYAYAGRMAESGGEDGKGERWIEKITADAVITRDGFRHKTDYDTGEESSEYGDSQYLERVEFRFDAAVDDSEYFGKIEDIRKKYLEEADGIGKEREDAITDAQEAYLGSVEKADGKYADKVASLDRKLSEDVARLYASVVDAHDTAGANARIEKAREDGREDEADRVLREFMASYYKGMEKAAKDADELRAKRDEDAESAKDERDRAVKDAADVRSGKIEEANSRYAEDLSDATEEATDRIQEVTKGYDKDKAKIGEDYNEEVGNAQEVMASKESDALDAAFDAVADIIEAGVPIYLDSQGIIAMSQEDFDDLTEEQKRTFTSARDRQAAAFADAQAAYQKALSAAKKRRWERLRDFPKLWWNRRLRFKCDIKPKDTFSLKNGWSCSSHVDVAFRNVVVHYRFPATTGADFSKYREELERWEEDHAGD